MPDTRVIQFHGVENGEQFFCLLDEVWMVKIDESHGVLADNSEAEPVWIGPTDQVMVEN